MRKTLLTFALLLFAAVGVRAQQGNALIIPFVGAPSGSCSPITLALNLATGDFYDCVAGSWNKINGTGGGGGLSGMTAGQIPVAATATTVTSSMPLAGAGAGITTGPASGVTSGDV